MDGEASEEELEKIKERLNVLTARFGDNPAYYAYLNQKYIDKKIEMEREL